MYLIISIIASKYDLSIETCSEGYDLTEFGINKSKCIYYTLTSKVIVYKVNVKRDDTQRDVCVCVKRVDIG